MPLHPILYTKKIAQKCDFSCTYHKNTLPLHRIQCKGSRWESCTVPLLWFAIRCSNSYKSLVLRELGRLNRRSDKSEDLLRATNNGWWSWTLSGNRANDMTDRFSILSMVRSYAYRYLIKLSSTLVLYPMVNGYILRGLSYHITHPDHHPAMLLSRLWK